MSVAGCAECGRPSAHRYQTIRLAPYPAPGETTESLSCTGCARAVRRNRHETAPGMPPETSAAVAQVDRRALIAHLDQFFAAAGIFDVCARCHDQGTGCCPPTCRVMGPRGCDPASRYGKTVFCAAFICSALLNTISEVDPECGRILRWVREQLGPAEFHIYEMITRVPAAHREPERPLALPPSYPVPPLAGHAARVRAGLAPLVEEILEIRRTWSG